jgi:hypothetical protein
VLFPILLLLVLLSLFSAVAAWRTRVRERARLRTEWGGPCDRERDMEAIADFFRAQNAGGDALDDRTWHDLLLDEVFAWIDRGQSRLGQQLLYLRLRSSPAPSLEAFDALVMRATDDEPRREEAQIALCRLGGASVCYMHRLARHQALQHSTWHVLFPIWSATIVLSLLLAFAWPMLLFSALIAFVVNLVIRGATGRRVSSEIVWFRHVGPLLSVGRALVPFGTPATAPITGRLAADLGALRRLGAIARWVSRDAATGVGGELASAVLEYLNVLLLMDVNALYFGGRELRLRGPALLRVIEAVGEIDAAIGVASWRAESVHWTRPRFAAPDAPAVLADLTHPLLAEPVPNSLTAAPPHGVLITGSNMSGKSTFLRTVGVNVVLAQTVYTALARVYDAPVYRVRSCIGRSDDLVAGKSYYLVEVESVLALVRASERREPHLFIFDELFRGTNAVERIAAAEAVLDALVGAGRPHLVLDATHDGELVDLLDRSYVVFHFGDAVGPDGLVFDYRLTSGPATSRNAITLLKLNGAPDALVARALARAAALDKGREQARAGVGERSA